MPMLHFCRRYFTTPVRWIRGGGRRNPPTGLIRSYRSIPRDLGIPAGARVRIPLRCFRKPWDEGTIARRAVPRMIAVTVAVVVVVIAVIVVITIVNVAAFRRRRRRRRSSSSSSSSSGKSQESPAGLFQPVLRDVNRCIHPPGGNGGRPRRVAAAPHLAPLLPPRAQQVTRRP
jgi:hypothetical protein